MKRQGIFFILIFLVGLGVGVAITKIISLPVQKTNTVHAVREKGFTYIRPLLRCDTSRMDEDPTVKMLHNKIEDYISQQKKLGVTQDISVYFRDPINGGWFSVNPDVTYDPASLVKVGVAITYYKIAEIYPESLAEKIQFVGPNQNNYDYVPKEQLQSGESYSVGDLVERSLVSSDNDALNLLLQKSDDSVFQKVFDDIQVNLKMPLKSMDFMTVRNYVSFFRTLFNSSYLSDVSSEKLLKLMTKSEFTKGIVGGVPEGVPVAHKFGEQSSNDTEMKQLHDCGIVYAVNKPYILCVMSRGKTFSALEETIQKISSITYDSYVVNRK